MVRSRETFMARNQTKDFKTLRGYNVAIDNFENYCMEKHGKADVILELKEFDKEQIYDFLQLWINWNDHRNPSTIKGYFSKIKKYLYHRGIGLHQQDINEELEFRSIIQEERYGLTLDDIQTIIKPMRYKHRTQFICQLSSLMRIGELTMLKKKHLVLDKQNIIVKIPSTIAKFKKGRTTFFSKEASKLLRPILRVKNDDDLVFGSNDIKTRAKLNSQTILRNALERTGRNMKYETSKRYMINTHSFRAYGITKLSRFDPNFAKKMAGQKGYLDQYDRMSDDEKLELYQKLEIILVEQNINIHKNIANLLSNHKEKLSICATITDIEKKNNETFLFCNEFFDALTFERCVLKENILYIVNIEKEKKNISEVLIKAGDSLIRKIEEYDLQIEENFYFEFPILEYEKYFYELSKKFSSLHVLVNDYGEKSDFFHSSPDPHGTCRCFYKHKVSRDFYNNIFDQDITYDVNFELLSLVAKKYGFKETGFYSQSDFLLSNNILDFIPSQMIEDSNQSLRDFKKLVSPNAFGEKFKFIIFKLNEK